MICNVLKNTLKPIFRSGLLCSLIKGSSDTLTLHDIQSWAVMTEDGEPAVTQRAVKVVPLEYPGKSTQLF